MSVSHSQAFWPTFKCAFGFYKALRACAPVTDLFDCWPTCHCAAIPTFRPQPFSISCSCSSTSLRFRCSVFTWSIGARTRAHAVRPLSPRRAIRLETPTMLISSLLMMLIISQQARSTLILMNHLLLKVRHPTRTRRRSSKQPPLLRE